MKLGEQPKWEQFLRSQIEIARNQQTQKPVGTSDSLACDPLTNFAETCADALLDNAEHFTCDEAEAVALLFLSIGREEFVADFLGRHAEEDECFANHGLAEPA